MNVACSSSSGAELGAGLGKSLKLRGGTASSSSAASLWRFVEVASATTTRVNVLVDSWVRLGELVWHAD